LSFATSTTEIFDPDGFHITGLSPGLVVPAGLGGEYQLSFGVGISFPAEVGHFAARAVVSNNAGVPNELGAATDPGTEQPEMRVTMQPRDGGNVTGAAPLDWVTLSRLVRLQPGADVRLECFALSPGQQVKGWVTAHMVRHDPSLV
jgi:hypothetical protein